MSDSDKERQNANLAAALLHFGKQRELERQRYLAGFDGLLGRFPEGSSSLLVTIIREIQQYLMRKYSEERARTLLQVAKGGMHAHEDMLLIPEGDLLALSILSKIHHALDAESNRSLELLLGKAGAREYKRHEASKRERHPEVNAWIDKQLAVDPGAKGPEMYRRAPSPIKDVVQEGRFCKRVTAARKRLKKDASQ